MARDFIKDPPLFRTRFTATARAYSPVESEINEAKASIDRLRGLLPSDIDPADHPTILYIVGNLFVGGTINKNDDAVTLEDTLKMYKAFEGQQINIEHNRSSVVGYIVRAGLSEFGTDRLISEEEARAAGQPVNVAIAVALWKVVDKDLVQYILNSAIPGSPTRDDLSLSFEVGFDSYDIVVLPRGAINLATVTQTVTAASTDFKSWDKKLRVNKGSGELRDGCRVGRVLNWPITPMGGGIVAQPAGAVKGITPVLSAEQVEAMNGIVEVVEAGMYSYSSTQCTLSAEAGAPFMAYSQAIPEEHIYSEVDKQYGEMYGREKEPHITVKYGIKGTNLAPIQLSLQGSKWITAKLGKITAFEREDKPYDVLKIDVISDDLTRLNALIRASCDCEDTYPEYHPHLTLAYLKKGMAAQYVGDTRFEGQTLTFASVTFSPHDGERTEIWLEQPTVPPMTTDVKSAKSSQELVYNPADPCDLGSSIASMTQPTKTLKLSAGWQEKLAALQSAAGESGLSHGVDVVLSDGRTIKAMKIVDAATLGSDIEYSYDGVVITSMTPGVPAPEYLPPGKNDVYPVTDVEARAEAEKQMAQQKEAQNAGYTGASLTQLLEASIINVLTEVAKRGGFLNLENTTTASVSNTTNPASSTSNSMKLEDLKQSVASVKSVEDLPTVMANVASFVDILAKASEEQAAARVAAEQAAQTAQATLSDVQNQLAALTKSHNELLAAQQAAAAEQVFQTHMASVEEVFAFDDEARAEIVNEIKACADETAFAAWMTRAKKMYKGFLKKEDKKAEKAKASECEDDEGEDMDDGGEEAKAAAKVALASASNNIVDPAIHNSITPAPAEKSLAEKYAEILRNHTTIGGVKVANLEAAAKETKKTR